MPVKKMIYVLAFIVGLITIVSFKKYEYSSEPIKKIIVNSDGRFNHEYAFDDQGILLYVLTTSISSNQDSGSLVQKIVFDTSGIVRDIFVITDTKVDDEGFINYSDQVVKFDGSRDIIYYRFSRNFKKIDSKIYNSSKKKYIKS